MGIDNAIAVMNGKGGVLKTSIAANLAGLAAAGGWRVLVVDADHQGNLGRDLGYIGQADGGAAFARAIVDGTTPEPLRDVRPGLDVVVGGDGIEERLVPELQRILLGGGDPWGVFERAFQPLAPDYDLIVFDSPPGGLEIQRNLLRAVGSLVIPTTTDDAGIDGLGRIARRAAEQRQHNPQLELLGIVVTLAPESATKVRRETFQDLEALSEGELHIFSTVIRAATAQARDLRKKGWLAHEYEAAAKAAEPRWKLLRRGERPESFSSADLAGDYQALANEVIDRFTEVRAKEAV